MSTQQALPVNIQDRIARLSEMATIHLLHAKTDISTEAVIELRERICQRLTEGITQIIEEAKT